MIIYSYDALMQVCQDAVKQLTDTADYDVRAKVADVSQSMYTL
jgi:hypothetical protein